jgi:imidazolonepropionase-like amidohydrolase
MKKILFFSITIFLTVPAFAQVKTGSMLIKNGTVLTVTKGTLENTDVLVEKGKIKQIGKNLTAPANVETIDATGLYVMPGIIDAHSHIAIDAVNEGTNPVTAEVFTGDAIDPFDVSIYRSLAGGCTMSHALHGSANAIGGQSETLKHRWGTTNPEDLRMADAPRTIKFALGENPMRSHGEGRGVLPRTRMGVEFVIRKSFAEGKKYMEDWDKYNKEKTANPNAVAPAYNYRLQAMADIIKGDLMIHCHSYRADEIYMLLGVLKDYGVKKVVFQHVNEGFKVAPELAAFGAGASVFADWWAYKFEVYYSTPYNAAILVKNGVVTSINSDSGDYIRHLYHQAAKTQRYGGLTDDEALALITINAAKQLGVENRVGSLEVGKEADIAIFKNHPLSIYGVPQKTIVDGIVYFDIAKDMDDVRLDVNPEEAFPAFSQEARNANSHDRCMQGVMEQLFGVYSEKE